MHNIYANHHILITNHATIDHQPHNHLSPIIKLFITNHITIHHHSQTYWSPTIHLLIT